MDCNQIYVNLLFEYKKNKLNLYLMPSFSFIENKCKKVIPENKNHLHINFLWIKHIEKIQTKIFNDYNIYMDINLVKKYCNELPYEYQNHNILHILSKADEINKNLMLNL